MLLAAVCALAPPPHAPPPHAARPGVHAAFERQDRGSGVLRAPQLRRALSELGVDVSGGTATHLLALYGNASAVDADSFQSIVDRSAVASPARFWLAVDPRGDGPRRTRRAWHSFGRAGLLTPARVAHYTTGLASLAVGTYDLADFVLHGGLLSLDADAAAAHGALHTAAAVLSLPRFRYRWTPGRPWRLWMPTARDANMWPSALVFSWYTLAMLSTYVQPPGHAQLACDTPSFAAFTLATSAALVYGTARTVQETDARQQSGVYATRAANVLQVAWSMSVPVLADTGKCLFVAHDPGVYAAYTDLVTAYPQYTQIYLGALLAAMYLGNVACALSSAEHHGAVSKAQIGDSINALTLVSNVVAVAGMCRVDGGRLALGMIGVTWDGMLHLLTKAAAG